MKFFKQFLLDTLEDGTFVVEDVVVGKSRWANQHRLTFFVGGKYYQAVYSRGTGDEGEAPWPNCV